MRFILVNRFFGGKKVPTGRMLEDVARELIKRGHKVKVLASNSSYTQEDNNLPGYEGIDVTRVWTVGDKSRLLNWVLFWIQAMVLIPILRWDRCLILTDPPFMLVSTGLAKLLYPKRKIYWWTMDLYPEALVADNILAQGSCMVRFLGWLNELGLAFADGVIPLGPCQEKRLGKYSRWSRSPTFSQIVPPWDARPLKEIERGSNRVLSEFGWHDKTVVLYAGNIGHAHTFKDIIEAARIFYDQGDHSFVFAFFCRGARRRSLEYESKDLPNILVHEYVPDEKTADLLQAADVHLITLENGWQGIVVPSKLYGVIKTGAPILFIGPQDADTAEEIRRLDLGIILPNGCGGSLVAENLRNMHKYRHNTSALYIDGAGKIANFITK